MSQINILRTALRITPQNVFEILYVCKYIKTNIIFDTYVFYFQERLLVVGFMDQLFGEVVITTIQSWRKLKTLKGLLLKTVI